jgi:hypothetical protein
MLPSQVSVVRLPAEVRNTSTAGPMQISSPSARAGWSWSERAGVRSCQGARLRNAQAASSHVPSVGSSRLHSIEKR